MFLKKIIPISIVAILGAIFMFNKNNDEDMTLRVAFPYNKPVEAYEPTKIHLGPEYIFLENIYSPLIELSTETGKPQGGVASKFYWKDGSFMIHLRKGLKTIDGYEITAKDAEFSLKRLLVMSSNTHGNFKDIICPESVLKTVESHCDGIQIVDDYTLSLNPGEEKPFLAHMLTAIDFAVIPKTSVDPKTLKIVDYRNTSGPYFVENSDDKGNIELKINSGHYHYSKELPQNISLVPSGIDGTPSAVDLFKNGKIDHITTIDKVNPEKIIKLSKESEESYLHKTMNIRTFALFFTEKGLKRFSAEERLQLGKTINEALDGYFLDKPGFEERKQFFPSFGDGKLSDAQKEKLETTLSKISKISSGKNIKLSLLRVGSIDNYKEKLEKALPGITIFEGKKVPALSQYKNIDEMPDLFIGGPDITFNEDISLITYSVNAGIFGMSKNERSSWIKSYMGILDKTQRLQKLQDLHFNSLINGVIFPLAASPYVALLRKPWKSHLPQIFANNPLWTIKKN